MNYSLVHKLASSLSLLFVPVVEQDTFGSVYVTVHLRFFGRYYKTQMWHAKLSPDTRNMPAHCLQVYGKTTDIASVQTGRSLSLAKSA